MAIATTSKKTCGELIALGFRIYRIDADAWGLRWHLVRKIGAVA